MTVSIDFVTRLLFSSDAFAVRLHALLAGFSSRLLVGLRIHRTEQ